MNGIQSATGGGSSGFGITWGSSSGTGNLVPIANTGGALETSPYMNGGGGGGAGKSSTNRNGGDGIENFITGSSVYYGGGGGGGDLGNGGGNPGKGSTGYGGYNTAGTGGANIGGGAGSKASTTASVPIGSDYPGNFVSGGTGVVIIGINF